MIHVHAKVGKNIKNVVVNSMKKKQMLFFLKYTKENWKMIIHLLFGTYHFGVNNSAWVSWNSLFGKPAICSIIKSIQNFKLMRTRAFIGFIPLNDAIKLFPVYAKNNGYKPYEL